MDGFGLSWQPSEIERMSVADILFYLDQLTQAREALKKAREKK